MYQVSSLESLFLAGQATFGDMRTTAGVAAGAFMGRFVVATGVVGIVLGVLSTGGAGAVGGASDVYPLHATHDQTGGI